MSRRASDYTKPVSVEDLQDFRRDWDLDARTNGHSILSIKSRNDIMDKFFWFLNHRLITEVGTREIKEFMLYPQVSHEEPCGRWGNLTHPRSREPMNRTTVNSYMKTVRSFFNYLRDEEFIDEDYFQRIKMPRQTMEIKPPIPDEDLRKLFEAAKSTKPIYRDTAILLTLLDSGLRAQEFCNLKVSDFEHEDIRVLGKGGKYRTIRLSPVTVKAIRAYNRKCRKRRDDSLFVSRTFHKLTRSGLYQILNNLAEIAKVPNPGVHAFRRTCSVKLHQNQTDLFSIMAILGHSTLTMTKHYTKTSDANIEQTMNRCSPVMNFDF